MKAIIGKFSSDIHNLLMVAVVLLFLLSLISCEKSNDGPPHVDDPEPEAHNGTFISTNGIFTFHGNKEKVFVEFDEEYMSALDNPPNNTFYNYVFTWYEFGECRYDVATNMKLYHVESGTLLDFSLEGNTTADKIIITHIVPSDKKIIFIKQ
ncbi:MAG: hypothetical protein ACERLG_04860 [Sedimentibacter sp.]